jgi:6-phosphogluconolactonase (cycloisomerase 2 family)
MKSFVRLVSSAALAVALVGAFAVPALADPSGRAHAQGADHHAEGADHVVFVQTDNTAGNQVVAYDRANNGALTLANTYDTGGLGGVLNGSVVDHLASQGSLTYDQAHALLYAVNAASNTVSVFAVNGDRLVLRQVVDSGGTFPVSVAVHGDLVYVLNAQDGGSVSGYRVDGAKLHRIEGSVRSLGLTIPTDTSQFTHTPGQVAFSPDGTQLIVTTKATTNAIDVFAVGHHGRLSDSPVVNSEPGTVPFAVSFDAAGHLVVAEAGTNALAAFTLNPDGTVTLIDAVPSGQAATCWVALAQGNFFTSNAGSPSVSGYQAAANGQLTLVGSTATDPGTVDAAASTGGQFLYVQTGKNGIVDEFQVNANGTLTAIGSVTVAGAAGGEGIVAN